MLTQRGFTVVETSILVLIVGVVIALSPALDHSLPGVGVGFMAASAALFGGARLRRSRPRAGRAVVFAGIAIAVAAAAWGCARSPLARSSSAPEARSGQAGRAF